MQKPRSNSYFGAFETFNLCRYLFYAAIYFTFSVMVESVFCAADET